MFNNQVSSCKPPILLASLSRGVPTLPQLLQGNISEKARATRGRRKGGAVMATRVTAAFYGSTLKYIKKFETFNRRRSRLLYWHQQQVWGQPTWTLGYGCFSFLGCHWGQRPSQTRPSCWEHYASVCRWYGVIKYTLPGQQGGHQGWGRGRRGDKGKRAATISSNSRRVKRAEWLLKGNREDTQIHTHT